MKKSIGILINLIVFFSLPLHSYENTADLYKTGAALAKNGEIDKAIIIFNKVISQNPYYTMGYYGLGKAYMYKFGMNDQAVKNLKISVTLDKNLVKGHFYLGLAYYLGKKYKPAIHAFQKAYELDNYMLQALYNIGAIYDVMDNSYQAKIYFKKYLKIKNKSDDDINFD